MIIFYLLLSFSFINTHLNAHHARSNVKQNSYALNQFLKTQEIPDPLDIFQVIDPLTRHTACAIDSFFAVTLGYQSPESYGPLLDHIEITRSLPEKNERKIRSTVLNRLCALARAEEITVKIIIDNQPLYDTQYPAQIVKLAAGLLKSLSAKQATNQNLEVIQYPWPIPSLDNPQGGTLDLRGIPLPPQYGDCEFREILQ